MFFFARTKKQPAVPETNVEVDLTTAMIREQRVADRLPKPKEKIMIRAPSYYMNNRKIFTPKTRRDNLQVTHNVIAATVYEGATLCFPRSMLSYMRQTHLTTRQLSMRMCRSTTTCISMAMLPSQVIRMLHRMLRSAAK